MSININKYNKKSDYLTDNNKPVGENIVSLVDTEVVYDGVNVMLDGSQLNASSVCVVLFDNYDQHLVFVPVETYVAAGIDTDRYTVQTFLLYGMAEGKKLYMHKDNAAGSPMWATSNRYKLECDTTAAGGFHWAITINGAAKSGDVTWAESDTLASIAAQINAVANIATVVEGDSFIRITVNSYSNSTLTLTDNTGGTLTDLSIYCKIDGVAQAETHRTWQAQSVASLFPGSGFLAANTVQYARNGLNLSYRCGANLAKFKSYYRTNGSATWITEGDSSSRLSEAAFNNCADGTVGGAAGIALYNKYNGSWDAYMEASMLQLNDAHRAGVEFKSYNNGVSQNGFLASVTTMTFDGTYVPAYPAAAAAAAVTVNGQAGCLPTNHEIGLFMEDGRMARINKGLEVIGGTKLTTGSYYWGVAECNAYGAWLYAGFSGCLNNGSNYNTFSVRPTLASA